MRLLEPLNGVKLAQGHYMMHLVMFVSMLFVKQEKHLELMKESTHAAHGATEHHADEHGDSHHLYLQMLQEEPSFEDEDRLWFQQDDLMFLSGHGAAHEEHHESTPAEKAQMDMQIFKMLQGSHLLAFIAILIKLSAKSRNYYNFASAVHCLLVIPVALVATMLAIFTVKSNKSHWYGPENCTEIRVWIMVDIYFFFAWIISGLFFVTMAYIFKFRTYMKNEDMLLQDDNPWNDRDTEDFLRHLKMEYLLFSYYFASILMDYAIGFHNGEDMGSGPKDWYPCTAIIGLDIIIKLLGICMMINIAINKSNINDTKTRVKLLIVTVANIAATVYMISLFYASNKMEGQNLFCKLWAQTLMCCLLLEPIWVVGKMYFEAVLQSKLMEEISNLQSHQNNETTTFAINKDDSDSEHEGGKKMSKKEKREMVKNKIQSRQKSSKQLELEENFGEKDVLELEEEELDIGSLTVLAYLKTNQEEFMIVPEKRAQMFYMALVTQGIVFTMLFCMSYGIYINEEGSGKEFSHSFTVFFVKLPCTIALHLLLYPEVATGLDIMKFANQNPDLFIGNGAEIAFILGLIQVFMAVFCEAINVFLLTYQHTTDHCIIHFVALEVIMEVTNYYFEAMMDNKLKNFICHKLEHDPPCRPEITTENGEKRRRKGSDNKFSERSCFHKVARIMYKTIRMFYVGLIFYFIPFSTLFMQYIYADTAPHGASHGGGH